MIQLNQLTIDGELGNLRTVDRDSVKNAFDILNSLLADPCKVSVSGTVLSVGGSSVTTLESDGSYGTQASEVKSIPPISGKFVDVAAGTIDFSNGSVTGSFATGRPGLVMSINYYVGVALELRSDKQWYLNFGTATATKADALNDTNCPSFTSDATLKKGYLVLQKTGLIGEWNFSAPSMTDFVALPVGSGSGGSGGSKIAATNITTASAGTWTTDFSGTPRVALWYYDDSAGTYTLMSPASYSIDTDGVGGIDYDFTSLTFDSGDYVQIVADFGSITSTPSTEYDSGFITVSAINNTLKGATVSGYHEVTLPSGFVTFPKGYTVIRNDGSNIYPADPASTLVFSVDGGSIRVAVDTNGWASTDTFNLICSQAALPTGIVSGPDVAETLENKTIDGDLNTISNLRHGDEVDDPSSSVHGVVGDVVGTQNTQSLILKTIVASQNNISGLLHGTHVDNPSSGVHGVTGNLLGTTDAQGIENKYIIGGTASETIYWTVPSHTTTGLESLPNKKASIAFDETDKALKVNDGSGWLNSSGGSGGTGHYVFAQGYSGPNINGGTNIAFIEVFDALNEWSGSQFTPNENGFYIIFGAIQQSITLSGPVYLYKNGTENIPLSSRPGNSPLASLSGMIYLTTSDTITFRTSGTIVPPVSIYTHYILIKRII